MKTILLSTVAAVALSFPAMAQAPKTFAPNENVQTEQSSSQQPAPMDKGAEGADANAIPGIQAGPQPGAQMGSDATVGAGAPDPAAGPTPGLITNQGEEYDPNANVQTQTESSQQAAPKDTGLEGKGN